MHDLDGGRRHVGVLQVQVLVDGRQLAGGQGPVEHDGLGHIHVADLVGGGAQHQLTKAGFVGERLARNQHIVDVQLHQALLKHQHVR